MSSLALAIEAAGWAGALMVLVAYGLASAGRLEPRTPLFQWLNFGGAAGFVVNSGWHGAIPSMVLNIIWCAIALFTLYQMRRA
ncbi:CBU_0592 family membrane protein [Sandarakinorhabdus rubra]|uniref:CBU_0592 family membrane protein n=1 Tax=Sandarakinorhabdus rubra TaxID=2672568 RepID=UPI0013DC31A3|nr:hypothetical protein [Sandarakinorhabdus rubra]